MPIDTSDDSDISPGKRTSDQGTAFPQKYQTIIRRTLTLKKAIVDELVEAPPPPKDQIVTVIEDGTDFAIAKKIRVNISHFKNKYNFETVGKEIKDPQKRFHMTLN